MKLQFFNMSGDHRRVNKFPYMSQTTQQFNINQIEGVDLITPTFIISVPDNYELQKTYNYAYCDDIKRYYFVRTIETVPAKKARIECLVDVRMSFINNNDFPISVIRNEFIKSNIPDKQFPIDPNKSEIEAIPLSKEPFAYSQGSDDYPYFYDLLVTLA